LNGPTTAEGKQCAEGWKLYQMPGPQFKNLNQDGSANHAYYIWVDRYNTFGLGANVPIASANGGEALLAVVDGKLINLRMPYPLGFSRRTSTAVSTTPKRAGKAGAYGLRRAPAPASTTKAAWITIRRSTKCR
jgi:hypothetical protein